MELVVEMVGNGPCHAAQAFGLLELPVLCLEFRFSRFSLFSLGDVIQHDVAYGRAVGVLCGGRYHPRPEDSSIRANHPQFARLRFTGLKELFVVEVVNVLSGGLRRGRFFDIYDGVSSPEVVLGSVLGNVHDFSGKIPDLVNCLFDGPYRFSLGIVLIQILQ